jgi:YD repeat-containing protein
VVTTLAYDGRTRLTARTTGNEKTTYTYDALNRVASVSYGTVTHTYQYDQGAYGRGRLTRISEPESTTDSLYDAQGRVTTETRTIGGVAHVTGYTYDAFGRLTRITYPSGREINYGHDSAGRVHQITTTKGGLTQTLVSQVSTNRSVRPRVSSSALVPKPIHGTSTRTARSRATPTALTRSRSVTTTPAASPPSGAARTTTTSWIA